MPSVLVCEWKAHQILKIRYIYEKMYAIMHNLLRNLYFEKYLDYIFFNLIIFFRVEKWIVRVNTLKIKTQTSIQQTLCVCKFGYFQRKYATHVHNKHLQRFLHHHHHLLTLSFTRNVTHILSYLLLYKTSTCFNINIFTSPNLYHPDHSHIYQTHLITI